MEIGIYVAILLLTFFFQLLKRLSGAKAKRLAASNRGVATQKTPSAAPQEYEYEYDEDLPEDGGQQRYNQTSEEQVTRKKQADQQDVLSSSGLLKNFFTAVNSQQEELQQKSTGHKDKDKGRGSYGNERAAAVNGHEYAQEYATEETTNIYEKPLQEDMASAASLSDVAKKMELAKTKLAAANLQANKFTNINRKRNFYLRTLKEQLRSTKSKRQAIVLADLLLPPLAARKEKGDKTINF